MVSVLFQFDQRVKTVLFVSFMVFLFGKVEKTFRYSKVLFKKEEIYKTKVVVLRENIFQCVQVNSLVKGDVYKRQVVNSLRVIAPDLPFPIVFHELKEKEEVLDVCGCRITAFRVNHNITCYGYTIEIDRAGKFDVNKAKENNVEMQYWNRLQKGETIELPDRTLTSDLVLGPSRKGIKCTYTTDTLSLIHI